MTYKERVEGVLDGYKNYVVESMTLQATDVSNKKINKHQATQQIINLIESELLTVREELIEQVRDKKPAKLKSVRGAKNVSSARIGYIGGWNAYYEKLQPILTDIKNKLIDGEKK